MKEINLFLWLDSAQDNNFCKNDLICTVWLIHTNTSELNHKEMHLASDYHKFECFYGILITFLSVKTS